MIRLNIIEALTVVALLQFVGSFGVGCTDAPSQAAIDASEASADTWVDTAHDAGATIGGDSTVTADGRSPDTASGPDATHTADASETSQEVGPPYPVVLAHGLSGFEHLSDAERLSYYFEVPAELREEGEVVYTAEVDPFNDSYDRGRELLEQIEGFLQGEPHEKVNIIGHSQGALDARYVAHQRPEMVASVVTISGPHGGTPISDIVLRFVEHRWAREIIDEFVSLWGRSFYDAAGEKTSLFEAFEQFSEEEIEEFNRRITDRPGVYYASVAGVTDEEPDGDACEADRRLDFIHKWRETEDPVDPTFQLTERVLDGTYGRRLNDGLVRVRDAKWGEFLGCVPADHLDEIGQIAGDPPGPGNTWEHDEFYVALVDFLHDEGY